MDYVLTITGATLHAIRAELSRPGRMRVCRAGTSCRENYCELLVHDTNPRLTFGETARPQLVAAGADVLADFEPTVRRAAAYCTGRPPTGVLVVGTGQAAGRVAACMRVSEDLVQPFEAIRIVAPELPLILPTDRLEHPVALFPVPLSGKAARGSRLPPESVWSRSIGALGERTWNRQRRLHVAVVGCGRTGSLVATALRRAGVPRMTLVDPDRTEMHNLGEMDAVDAANLGQLKVQAIGRFVQYQDLAVECTTSALGERVLSFSALVALKPADVVFCCVDNPAARLVAACVAALYLKPLVDLGTGIFISRSASSADPGTVECDASGTGARQMGADVRLILPGRCLVCYGGIAGIEQARETLLAERAEPADQSTPQDAWRVQRAGSLRSLNGLAANLGLRLLEDLLSGRLADSTWLHLDFSQQGIPSIEHRTPEQLSVCPLCALAGQGDDGLAELRTAIQMLVLRSPR